ncbi:MAG: type toxin-antitoxin system prevent-host-death family antitoxin [Cryobacterium sp.]|jgi:antitoxin (DNA-binding transcriptional repressor) of toxin-antitoxin stability system|nr:type toxin-antitoxin system prevent-host-death family antitoxin [Cryobacterium sp.]
MYVDDPDQLPELPDCGPRDGRHGVDRDIEYDPYPQRSVHATAMGGGLVVSVEEAKRHLEWLLKHVEAGEAVVLTSRGHPVARLERHLAAATRQAAIGAAVVLPAVTVGVGSPATVKRGPIRKSITRAR